MSITCLTNIDTNRKHLRTLFESLYDGTHPLRIAQDITADLAAALEQFATIAEDLKG